MIVDRYDFIKIFQRAAYKHVTDSFSRLTLKRKTVVILVESIVHRTRVYNVMESIRKQTV